MRFVLVCFGFLGLVFYELSGGAEFEPRKERPAVAVAEATPATPRPVAGEDRVVPAPVRLTRVETPEMAQRRPTPSSATAQETETPSDQPSLAFRFNQPETDSDAANVQLASLADGGAFPQPAFLNPVTQDAVVEPVVAAAPVDLREVTGSRVNMRQGPGTTYPVIGTLFYDDQIEVLDDLGNGWVQLRKVGDNRIGWMAARFVGKPAN